MGSDKIGVKMEHRIKPVEKDAYIIWECSDGMRFYWYNDAKARQNKIG